MTAAPAHWACLHAPSRGTLPPTRSRPGSRMTRPQGWIRMSFNGSQPRALSRPRVSHDGLRHDAAHVPDLQAALDSARRRLLACQQRDGHWVGELQGDTILESEYVLLMAFLDREDEPRVAKAANYLLQHQLPEGGWNNFPEGPVEVSVSVKAYFALKLTGHDPQAPYMRRARDVIRAPGRAARCHRFTKFYPARPGHSPSAHR